ncbi:DUF1648 domain-containing protein [Flindersiella endophytica]
MSFRVRFIAVAGAWIAGLTGLLTAVLLVYRSRLPEPLASHWGASGRPDDSMPFLGLAAVVLLLWLAVAGIAAGAGLTGGRLTRRPVRAWLGAELAAGGSFVLGLLAVTVWANLDAVHWRQAKPVGWQVILVIAIAAAAGWLGWVVARHGPDAPPQTVRTEQVRRLDLRPGEHAVWVSATANTWLLGLGGVLLALAGAVAIGAAYALPSWMLLVSAALAAVTVACLAVSSIRVEVNEGGLTIAYGAWRWPRRRTPLRQIDSAWTEHRRPSEVGGWGYRGLPGSATIMIRGGECLVIRYRSGGQLRISVDDAENGAALLNALVQSP